MFVYWTHPNPSSRLSAARLSPVLRGRYDRQPRFPTVPPERPPASVSDSFLYRVPEVGPRWTDHFPSGTYETQAALIGALRAFSERHGLPSDLDVHVYRTDGTPLSVGRKYVGSIDADVVLTTGGVDMAQVRP